MPPADPNVYAESLLSWIRDLDGRVAEVMLGADSPDALVLILAVIDGLSVAEIAACTGESRSQVQGRLAWWMRRLGRTLTLVPPDHGG